MKIITLTLILNYIFSGLAAQTCCTGGVPYFGSFKIPAVNSRQIGLSFSYNYNKNSDLVLQEAIITNNSNERVVHTLLMQADYGLNDNLSFSIVFPYIIQAEVVNYQTTNYKISNQGISDIALWTSFRKAFGTNSLVFSAAVKVPSGKTDAIDDENGIRYPFSFQNGSGSWDFVINVYHELPLDKKRLFNWINQLSAKLNTAGQKFEAHPAYRFGHGFNIYSSLAIRWVMGKFLADGYTGLSFQKLLKDQFNGGFSNENTGGEWLYINFGYNHQFSPRLEMGLSGAIPVYRRVNGLQLTTNIVANATVGYIFN